MPLRQYLVMHCISHAIAFPFNRAHVYIDIIIQTLLYPTTSAFVCFVGVIGAAAHGGAILKTRLYACGPLWVEVLLC